MSSGQFVVYLTLILAHTKRLESKSKIRQDRRFISVETGGNLILQCFYEEEFFESLFWFKQVFGQKLRLISTFTKYKEKAIIYGEFEKSSRFSSNPANGKNHLNIKDLHISDSATYYCARQFLHEFELADGTVISVKKSSSDFQPLVHQPDRETISVGGSTTLNCTVHTGICDGEHSVYWFKDAGESHSGLIYIHRGRNDQCERNSSTKTQSCIYNLNISDGGTYYCAVASCGHILFGNGTKLDYTHDENLLVPSWRAAFVFSSILNVLLAFTICMINTCKPPGEGLSADEKVYRRAETIKHVYLSRRSGSQRDPTWSECVYLKL